MDVRVQHGVNMNGGSGASMNARGLLLLLPLHEEVALAALPLGSVTVPARCGKHTVNSVPNYERQGT